MLGSSFGNVCLLVLVSFAKRSSFSARPSASADKATVIKVCIGKESTQLTAFRPTLPYYLSFMVVLHSLEATDLRGNI